MSLITRGRRAGAVLATAATAASLLTFGAAVSASATTATTLTAGTDISGSQVLDQSGAFYDDGTFQAGIGVSTDLSWDQLGLTSVSFEQSHLRQGAAVDPTTAFSRPSSGIMTITYKLLADVGFEGFYLPGGVNEQFVASGPCDLKSGGGNYVCHLESNSTRVLGTGLIPGEPVLDVAVAADVTVTPGTLNALRHATIGGDDLASGTVPVPDAGATDALTVPCSAQPGDHLGYDLGALSETAGLSIDTGVEFKFGVVVVPLVVPTLGTATAHIDTATATQTMSGPGASWDLGAVQPNNVKPAISVANTFSGTEGAPIAFGADATGPCAQAGTYEWSFSDGSTAFGPTPSKSFADNGTYSGKVTVTDSTGLTDTANFTVIVLDAAPIVNVTPQDPTITWGRPLTLSAQATDPGAADQSTLTYAWNFGDGSPIATGGASVTHSWATPGDRPVSVTVSDKDGKSTTVDLTVHVTKRATTLGYTGANSGVFGGTAALSAALVDEYGMPVAGVSVDFAFDGSTVDSAQTNSSGVASTMVGTYLDPTVGHTVSAGFGGNALYAASSTGNRTMSIAKIGSQLVYTGVVKISPNKSAPLSATLTDALGHPLAGRTVKFQLGTQSVTATTSANGVASVGLVVNQKPGAYPLTVSWAPAGTDVADYLGSAVTTSFSINKK